MIVVGLTGSIAMGKSVVAKMFAAEGVHVFDSDAEVHRLYEQDPDAVAAIGELYPEAIVDRAVSRARLSEIVTANPAALRQLERIIHPLVRGAQKAFLDHCSRQGDPIAVLDIPLLFETGMDKEVDQIVVVSAPLGIQVGRALQRPGMTEMKFRQILSQQIADSEKRRRADFIIDNSGAMEQTRAQVIEIVSNLRAKAAEPK